MEFHSFVKNDKGFTWHQLVKNGTKILVKGDAFIGDEYFSTEKLADKIYELFSFGGKALNLALVDFNGDFSLIVESQELLLAAVDRYRSFPLFYRLENEELWVADFAENLCQGMPAEYISHSAKKEFSMFGYVTGSETLLEGINQIRPGELIVYYKQDNTLVNNFYYVSGYSRKTEIADLICEEKIEILDEVLIKAFQRFIFRLNGRKVVLSLSGGQDSRLIAVMLKRLGYTNVLTYTFGKADNIEYQKAKSVADSLGFEWIWIEYNASDWEKILREGSLDEYYLYSGNYTSIAHMATIPAITKLIERGLLSGDEIFSYGGRYDVTTGSWFPRYLFENRLYTNKEIEMVIKKRHASLSKIDKDIWANVSKKTLNECRSINSSEETLAELERWYAQERGGKFIRNTCRGYEYFGFKWFSPLEDIEIVRFWQSVDKVDYISRKLHYQYAEKYMVPYTNVEDRIPVDKVTIKDKIKGNYFINRVALYLRNFRKKSSQVFESDILAFFSCFKPEELRNMTKKYGFYLNGNTVNISRYLEMITRE